MRPPIEMPTTCADVAPASSSTAAQSAAIVSTVYGAPGTSPVRPAPRLSTRSTRYRSASAGTSRNHMAAG